MKPWMWSRAFIALIILHTALSFPTQPNHGFGFHRRGPRGTFAGIVLARKQKEIFMCRFAQDNSWNIPILKSLTTAVCCVSVCVVVHRSLGKVTDGKGESVDKVTATINERWGETNARLGVNADRIGAPFTLLCWSLGIYLLSKSGKVNRLQCVCPFL